MALTVPAGADLAEARLLIGGEWLRDTTGGAQEHLYPGNGRVNGLVHLAGAAEVDLAVRRAHEASPVWRGLTPDVRRDLIARLGRALLENADELIRITTLEMGAPHRFAQWNPSYAAQWFAYYAGWADKVEGTVNPPFPARGMNYTLAEPYGVVGLITAWNAPLVFIGMKIAPALAAGNCVVLKPSELAPYSSLRFAEIALEAGVPEGVINVVPGGPDAGAALSQHPGVGKISFTGSVPTARRVIEASAATIKPLALELGGKSANLIFPDADLDQAIPLAATFGLAAMSGQGCACLTRMLVHESIHDEVLERVKAQVSTYKMGDPFSEETTIGPLITRASQERVLGLIERAEQSGAGSLVMGGTRPTDGDLADGWFVRPTVLDDVDPDSEIAQEEIFGPVLSIMTFSSPEQAVQIANNSRFGLAANINTRDLSLAHLLASRLDAGSIRINGHNGMSASAPFGGYGESGYGREGGRAGLEEFLHIKNVFIALPDTLPDPS
ncbi:aldehyde dehydrogenase (NAD+) [Nocardioides sp. J9]|uniref:aldehyde dehydrogenase family protein n=1 Tax=Nocardioides sp. J9 TaxID=935844 RepID=UPI0011AD3B0A|nr:aldehyde dehydrogenase family protein [Nocardioides sp. J9]TWG98556.1 aldehyde dehydrogenase (NAD+) [Nocardioides sp. J9]